MTEVINIPIEARADDHRFFDPKNPERPEQILGLETEAILRLGQAATDLCVLPPKVNIGLYTLPDAVRLVPLVQEMQSGIALTPEDIRPYRKPIKNLSMGVSAADKVAATAGAIGIGIPLRRVLNRKIEREFPIRAAEAIDQAREAIASIENNVEHLASFDNPKEQFVTELGSLAQTVNTAIVEQRDRRVRGNISMEETRETPKGLAGFVTKAVRKIRDFFGAFKRSKPEVNAEITAYDAGAGIEQAISRLAKNPAAAESGFPLLSKLILNRLPSKMPLTKDRLALAAPEILNFLFSTADDKKQGKDLVDSVNRNPHELRFVTRFKKRYHQYDLQNIQRSSHTLMPAIRDILPTSGAQVREIFAQAQDLLAYKQPEKQVVHSPKVGIFNRFKNPFRRSRK